MHITRSLQRQPSVDSDHRVEHSKEKKYPKKPRKKRNRKKENEKKETQQEAERDKIEET